MNSETTPTAAPVDRFVITPFYDQDGITIYHGDCREVLPTLGKFDLLLTDPPYGIGVQKNLRPNTKPKNGKAVMKDYGTVGWDVKPDESTMQQVASNGQYKIIWGGNHFDTKPATCWLVWDKDNGKNKYADCELAWTNLPKAVRLIRWKWQGMLQENMGDKKEVRLHPTQKPLAVMKWAIGQAPDTVQTVLDPFMGVGTSLVAAKLMGKRAVGIEIEERYCEIAANRLRQGVLPFAG